MDQEKKGLGIVILRISLGLAIGMVLLSISAGLGNRMEWWDFRRGFSILTAGFFGAILTFLLALFGILKGPGHELARRVIWGVPPLVLSLILIIIPLIWIWMAKQVPRIHDITTDTENPPPFVAILPLRKEAPNSAVYGGKEIADQQKKGYPDLKPEMVPLDAGHAFQKALQAAEKMGWKIVDADSSEGRIEATDSTLWFGFKDDIVIRVIPVMGSSRIDVRSVSRVGLSDIGTNAGRIRKYLKTVKEIVSEELSL